MIFKAILEHAEPFALDLQVQPWRVSVRAQVIASFVAFALGKGGLFISSFLGAMAWLDAATYLPYAIACTAVTLAVMVVGYIATFGRIEAHFDMDARQVHLTKRAPFYRRRFTVDLAAYQGIETRAATDGVYSISLRHPDPDLNVPLSHIRRPETPRDEAIAYGRALGVAVFNPVELSFGAS